VLLNILVENMILFLQDNRKFTRTRNFCNIINVFTATFGQFNASIHAEKYYFFQEKKKVVFRGGFLGVFFFRHGPYERSQYVKFKIFNNSFVFHRRRKAAYGFGIK